MDRVTGFLYWVIDDGMVSTLAGIQERGVTPEMLGPTGEKALQFIYDYVGEYGRVPAKMIFCEKNPTLLLTDEPPAPLEYYCKEILRHALEKELNTGLDKIDELLTVNPYEALATLETVLYDIRKKQLGTARVVGIAKLAKEAEAFYEKMKKGEKGVLTPWGTVNEATGGFWPQDLVLIVGHSSVGKCVDATTEIVDPVTGIPHSIEEVCRDTSLQQVLTWGKESGVHSVPITMKVDTGRKECLQVTLSSGRSIVVTPEHPFLTPEGWVRADALSLGVTLGLPDKLPFPQQPISLPLAEIDLLAVLLADGTYTGNHVGFTKADPSIVTLCQEAASSFGAKVVYRSRCDYDFVANLPRNPIRTLLAKHGMGRTKSKHKIIPDAIYSLPKELLARFLAVFWMCDGHVTKRGALELTLASERMVRQHQHLLLRFGIQSRVVYKKALCAGAAFDAWRLCVYVRGNSQFLKEIPLWGEKRLRLEAGVVGKEERETIGMPCVSEAFRDTLREQITAKQLLGMRLASVSRNLGWDCKFYFEQLFAVGTKGRQIHLSRFKELCRVFGLTEQYAWLWGSDLFWDPIVSIRSAGERKIYDLSVLPTHCFIANDIVVHNTWMLLLMLIHAYRTGKKVLVVTTEMSQVRIIIRTLAMYLGLPFGTLRKGKLNDTQEAEFYEGVALLSVAENRFWVVGGDFDFKIDSLALAIEEVKPDIVGVDGAYLLKTSGKDRFDQAATAFNELKRMAKFKNVPILASMQFNREAKKGAIASVQMQNIAMTDVASWNADLCLALHQDEDMKKDKRMVMRWLKARDTFIPDMEINWDIENGNFEELLSEEEVATQAEQAATDGAPALDLTEDAELPF